MASPGPEDDSCDVGVSPCKKARLSPERVSWEPSLGPVRGEQEGSECGTSVDSGLSDTGATSPFERGSTPQEGDLAPETDVAGAEPGIPGGSGFASSSGQQHPQGAAGGEAEVERDDLSSLSGLSDMSGQEWKPNNMTGKLAWLHRCMARGEDPRLILLDLLPGGSSIPIEMDTMTLWKVLFNLLSEPPRREKLEGVNTLEDCVRLINNSKNIIVLTGAGVSVSCGIPDFRSKDGVYARLAVDFPDLPDPQAMFDIHYFRKDPRPFFKFAREIYPGQFEPSPCHRFIRCLETHSRLLRNYTQNIDTLEQVVGIGSVVQCHGSFATATCTMCKRKVEADSIRDDIFKQNIPLCTLCPSPDLEEIFKLKEQALKQVEESKDLVKNVAGEATDKENPDATSAKDDKVKNQSDKSDDVSTPIDTDKPKPGPSKENSVSTPINLQGSPFTGVPIMKPDIVFFGEGLSDDFHHAITSDKSRCDLLIVIGSSLKVRPVALIPSSLPPEVPQILINREPLPHCVFDVELLGDCDKIINQLCNMLGSDWTAPVHSPALVQHTGLPPPPPLHAEEEECSTSRETKDGTESERWRPKPSIAESIPEGQFLFLPPARYVFPGAEVTIDSSEDEDEDLESLQEEEGETAFGSGDEDETGAAEPVASEGLVHPPAAESESHD